VSIVWEPRSKPFSHDLRFWYFFFFSGYGPRSSVLSPFPSLPLKDPFFGPQSSFEWFVCSLCIVVFNDLGLRSSSIAGLLDCCIGGSVTSPPFVHHSSGLPIRLSIFCASISFWHFGCDSPAYPCGRIFLIAPLYGTYKYNRA